MEGGGGRKRGRLKGKYGREGRKGRRRVSYQLQKLTPQMRKAEHVTSLQNFHNVASRGFSTVTFDGSAINIIQEEDEGFCGQEFHFFGNEEKDMMCEGERK